MESKQIKRDAHQKKEQRAKKKLEKEINKQIKLQHSGNGPKPTSRWRDPTSGSSKRKSGPREKSPYLHNLIRKRAAQGLK